MRLEEVIKERPPIVLADDVTELLLSAGNGVGDSEVSSYHAPDRLETVRPPKQLPYPRVEFSVVVVQPVEDVAVPEIRAVTRARAVHPQLHQMMRYAGGRPPEGSREGFDPFLGFLVYRNTSFPTCL